MLVTILLALLASSVAHAAPMPNGRTTYTLSTPPRVWLNRNRIGNWVGIPNGRHGIYYYNEKSHILTSKVPKDVAQVSSHDELLTPEIRSSLEGRDPFDQGNSYKSSSYPHTQDHGMNDVVQFYNLKHD
ncbi:MAG: hypothetical protein DHS80DRAFT_29962 [Piptocephalis tieghemiana]|nr:MAG: hypothetical protein DHS80DRAFT_29962 [Piptocephalis tieghemiana]